MPLINYEQSDVRPISKVKALNTRLYSSSACGKIYASYVFDEFRFKEGIIFEDDASYYILADRARKIALLNESLYYYFSSPNSIMRNDNAEINDDFIGVYEDRIKYFVEKNDKIFIDGSYERYCLVLVLKISVAIKRKNSDKHIRILINKFRFYYGFIKKSKHIALKDRIIFALFNIAPKFVGRIIGRLKRY